MHLIEHLIDKFRATGSQRALADKLGVTNQRLSDWKHGRMPMPEHQFARLAELVEGETKAKSLLWDFVHEKQRTAKSTLDKVSASFKAVLLLANPRRGLFSAG